MGEIKRVNGQILRKELKEMRRLTIYYDLLQEKLDSLNDIIYSHDKTREEINVLMVETNEIEKVLDGTKLEYIFLTKEDILSLKMIWV